MRVYEGDWPEGMIFELRVGADEVESVGDAIQDAITALEAAHEEAHECIAACDRAADELRRRDPDALKRFEFDTLVEVA